VELIDSLVFFWAVLLLVLGLVFEASGFGIFVAGRLDGFILIVIGVTMYWGGWILSRARSFSCALAAILNMFDAASTVSFWNFEINPIVLAAGPTIFMIAKIACSLTIMLYAKLHTNPRKGGVVLTVFFAFIVAWNLSQHLMAYLGFKDFVYGLLLGTIFSFVASAIVLYTLFISVRMKLPKQLQTHILSVLVRGYLIGQYFLMLS
jgi:hypothetical protein